MIFFKQILKDKLHALLMVFFYLLVGSFFSFLFATNLYSRLKPDFSYTNNGYVSSIYSNKIKNFDEKFNLLSKKDFIYFIVEIFPSEMRWGDQLEVSFLDNWLLASTQWIDPILSITNLQKEGTASFKYFQSHKYSRGLARGSGLCSQLSYTLADLLYSRYGIKARMIGLDGHVVVSIILDDKSELIADPSLGLVLPFGINDVNSHKEAIVQIYKAYGQKFLADFYFSLNFIQSNYGAFPYYDHKIRGYMLMAFERITDVLSILLSMILALISFFRAAMKYRATYS